MNPTSLLADLHTYLLRIRTVTEELDDAPRRLKKLQNKVVAAEKALADHHAAIKTTKVAIHEHDVSLKANSARIEKCKRDLNNIVSKKESDALTIEIASLEKKNDDLADEGLELMAKVDEMTAKITEFEQAIAKAKEEHAAAVKEHEAQLPGWNNRLNDAKTQVATQLAQLPADWLKAFKRMEQSEGADALAGLNGRSCSACYTEVTAQQLAVIKSGSIEACKNCGRMLYVVVAEG
jgi:predicted  nucleic acid-binding Zn-ribbon protein